MPYSGGSSTALSNLGSGLPEAVDANNATLDNAAAKVFDVVTTASAKGKVKNVQIRTNQAVPAGVTGVLYLGPNGTETEMLRVLDGDLPADGNMVSNEGNWPAYNGDQINISWTGGAGAATDVDIFVQYEDDANVTIS